MVNFDFMKKYENAKIVINNKNTKGLSRIKLAYAKRKLRKINKLNKRLFKKLKDINYEI